jgi:putative aminopeptidase FrvX
VQTAVVPRTTSTDADDLAIQRDGIPTILLELPLKYMHTTVELFDMHTLEEGARLLAHFAAAVDESWEEALWT